MLVIFREPEGDHIGGVIVGEEEDAGVLLEPGHLVQVVAGRGRQPDNHIAVHGCGQPRRAIRKRWTGSAVHLGNKPPRAVGNVITASEVGDVDVDPVLPVAGRRGLDRKHPLAIDDHELDTFSGPVVAGEERSEGQVHSLPGDRCDPATRHSTATFCGRGPAG
jgi:hypothetical protein